MYLQALEESDTVAKAWFRRGEAQLALNDCESARADFDKCLQLEPDNKVRAMVLNLREGLLKGLVELQLKDQWCLSH